LDFEQKFKPVIHHVTCALGKATFEEGPKIKVETSTVQPPGVNPINLEHQLASQYNTLCGMTRKEHKRWLDSYQSDSYFQKVWEKLTQLVNGEELSKEQLTMYTQFSLDHDKIIRFEDGIGNFRICVPESLRWEIIRDSHDNPMQGAHEGYYKTYNRIAGVYFWPRMSRDIKHYVFSCDICQKSKPRHTAPIGLLSPIPIPTKPFEVISMDFIPELPMTKNGYNNILVIVDKLTKYGIFIPTTTHINEIEVAKMLFHHIISKYGIPKQIISDRDSKFTGTLWGELCKLIGAKRALTTSYHPQADGQTEALNQTLEIALRCYVNPTRDNWDEYLDPFTLSYNTSCHSSTGYSPSFLLMGYHPQTDTGVPDARRTGIERAEIGIHEAGKAETEIIKNKKINQYKKARTVTGRVIDPNTEAVSNQAAARDAAKNGETTLSRNHLFSSFHSHSTTSSTATDLFHSFNALRSDARDNLVYAQHRQARSYNKNRRNLTFAKSDLVLINPHSLRLLRKVDGLGRKLLARYEGPFEVLERVKTNTYRLRMPASYGIHPVIHAEHLTTYTANSTPIVDRPTKSLSRDDFDTLHEFEIEKIVSERKVKRGKRLTTQYKVRWKDYDESADTWEPERSLKNAPAVLRAWKDAVSNASPVIAEEDSTLNTKISKLPLSSNNGRSRSPTRPSSTPTPFHKSKSISESTDNFPMDLIIEKTRSIDENGPPDATIDNSITKKEVRISPKPTRLRTEINDSMESSDHITIPTPKIACKRELQINNMDEIVTKPKKRKPNMDRTPIPHRYSLRRTSNK
jgi:hypothetical protein